MNELKTSKKHTDNYKIIHQRLLRIYNGDYDDTYSDLLIDKTAEKIEKMIDDAAKNAVFLYRVSILQECYDTETDTYDKNNIADMVIKESSL